MWRERRRKSIVCFCLFPHHQALLRYRLEEGHEAVRVCGVCGDGAGEKLKRCANCTEVYCSQACQRKDWLKGHKQLCNKLDEPFDSTL